MTILVLNLGSTSFKFELFNAADLASIKKGDLTMQNHEAGMNQDEIDKIFRETLRQIGDVSEVQAVGHRVVHGGDKFLATQKIDLPTLNELENLNHLAPLHNPDNLAGIKSALKYLPNMDNYAVFDTAFFKDLPESAKIYPIPYKYYEEQGIHKFGFHGISHQFAGREAAKKIKIPFDRAKLITVHLGGGCSITAIEKGKPIETSMGFTPLEGLMMMTRPGDVDDGIILKLAEYFAGDLNQVENILNYESGIKGICGLDNYLDLLKAVGFGEPKAKLAFEMFIHRIKKYIGAYFAILDGADALVFTGKIGAGKPVTRKKICDKMKILADVPVIVVEPHEELAIAREVKQTI